jgi:hypothetical protein
MSEEITKTIEIDCAPMTARPDTYIAGIIDGLGLDLRDPVNKLMGNWTWDYSDVPDDHWISIKPTLAERITNLYNTGYIRYGSW